MYLLIQTVFQQSEVSIIYQVLPVCFTETWKLNYSQLTRSLNYKDTKGHIINNLISTLTGSYTLTQADLKLEAIVLPQIPNC